MSVRYSDFDDAPMTAFELQRVRASLLAKREQVLSEAQRSPGEDRDRRPADENDRASEEVEELFARRLQERSRGLLNKLDKALARIETGEYDECEVCGDLIARARLMARPETTMCVLCKEEQERLERHYMKPRLRDEPDSML
jgi:DnaK suppressor protein